MFGYKIVPTREIQLWEQRVADQLNMLNRMETELGYWQTRADEERQRADRLNDVVMQQNGLPDVTPTVIKAKAEFASKNEAELHKHEAEVAEMFSDNFDGSDELNWIDPDLQEAARGWMETAKQARDAKKSVEVIE